jgi:diguanylate cyclase (GGDEF)-like protein
VAWATVGIAGAVFAVLVGFSRGVDGVTVWIETAASLVVICWMVVRIQGQSHRLRRMLSELARTDALTGLINRRGFDEALTREYERNRRGGAPLAVLLVDIDHFKIVNDTWGHPAGDVTLRRLGELLTNAFRPTDVVGRIGGEEFAVLIPDCDPAGAVRRAHELCDRVRTQARGWEHAITVSVGVAAHPEASSEPAGMIAAADAALYGAKAAGRDRVGLDDMPPKW